MSYCDWCRDYVRYLKQVNDFRTHEELNLCSSCLACYKQAEEIYDLRECEELLKIERHSVEMFVNKYSVAGLISCPYDDVYADYCDFCMNHDVEPKAKPVFSIRVRKHCGAITKLEKIETGEKVRYFQMP